ncbi:MAG: DUF3071 domain-containing protein [Actinobacteria bacterium]|nr:DUF3071 domain-containing protein [Actinomycetota bacterium]
MQELRLIAVSEDGSYAIVEVPGRSGRFLLPVDDRLRTVAKGQFSRLAQYEIEVENPLRPKEIQDRIRAGETAEEIADAAGIPPEKVRRFEGPVLAERAYRAEEAQRATIRGHGDSVPGPRLGDIVSERLSGVGAGADTEWDSRKRPDGNWQVQLQFTIGSRLSVAEWIFDPRRRHVIPDDEQATLLSLPAEEWAASTLADQSQNTATVTPIGSRQHAIHAEQQFWDTDRRSSPASGRNREAAFPTASRGPADKARGPSQAQEQQEQEVTAAPTKAAATASANSTPPPAQRPAKKSGRARRSSVPSWDEIMFGTSRPTD